MVFVNPLDLETIFVNIFAGNMDLFIYIAIIVISMMAAKFRMANIPFFIFLSLFAVIMSIWATWLYVFAVIITGLAVYFVIAKLIKN